MFRDLTEKKSLNIKYCYEWGKFSSRTLLRNILYTRIMVLKSLLIFSDFVLFSVVNKQNTYGLNRIAYK